MSGKSTKGNKEEIIDERKETVEIRSTCKHREELWMSAASNDDVQRPSDTC